MRRLAVMIAFLLLFSGCSMPRQSVPGTGKETEPMPTTENAAGFGCDVVFFGDSITADSDFTAFFPGLSIVNLGVYGDTLEDLLRRVGQVRAADPEKIFLLGGINCLRPNNVEECLAQYAELLDALKAACPRASVVVESVLPVAEDLDPKGQENTAVRRFNAALQRLAEEKGYRFADLWSAYEKDGFLDPALTRDGLHLNFNAYGPWAGVIAPFLNAQP